MVQMKEYFHSIGLKRKYYFSSILSKTDLNLMELELLAFIRDYPDSNTFTEIIRLKDYVKSHVSTSISHLVEAGYLEKQVSKTNKKIHYLILLDKSEQVLGLYDECLQNFRNDAFAGVTPEEMKIFKSVLTKISDNLHITE